MADRRAGGPRPCSVPKDVLKDYELGTKEVSFAQPQKKASLDFR